MAEHEVPRGERGEQVDERVVDALPVLSALLDASSDLVAVVDHEMRPIYLNRSARAFLGVAPDAPLDRVSIAAVLPGDQRDEYVAVGLDALAESDHWAGEVTLRRHDGVEVPVAHQVVVVRGDDRRMRLLGAVAHDVSERERLEARLEHEASHDALTGLANRRLLIERVTQALARSERRGDEVVVLFVDLDRFKSVNERFGHAVGDAVLHQVAQRLRGCMRIEDVVSRFGGDEFVILCEDLVPGTDPEVIARRIIDSVSAPYVTDTTTAVVEVSVGLVVSGPGAGSPDRLLRTADEAMYRAKERGRNQFEAVRLPPGY